MHGNGRESLREDHVEEVVHATTNAFKNRWRRSSTKGDIQNLTHEESLSHLDRCREKFVVYDFVSKPSTWLSTYS